MFLLVVQNHFRAKVSCSNVTPFLAFLKSLEIISLNFSKQTFLEIYRKLNKNKTIQFLNIYLNNYLVEDFNYRINIYLRKKLCLKDIINL